MLEVHERLGMQYEVPVHARLVLTHKQREHGRMRAFSADGEEVRLFLERGEPLKVGECLKSRCGRHIVVEGAQEAVVVARCDDWKVFSRACYHLGNRHVKVQIGDRRLTILPDHVLEELLVMLGLETVSSRDIFTPESGAYSNGHGHSAHKTAGFPMAHHEHH